MKTTLPSQKSPRVPHQFSLNNLASLKRPNTKNDIFSLPPWVYGSLYLALVPIFGALYTFVPDMAFNHDNMDLLDAMYFSAITVTTTGFGDITPSNSFTRGLVMVESIVGVIMAGLFLNSLNYHRQQHIDMVMHTYEAKKEISFAFARLRSHDSLITLNMNTYLNRVNQLLGIENPQTPVATSDNEGEKNLAEPSANPQASQIAEVPEALFGIHEPIPNKLIFADLQHLFSASSRLTDDPTKPQIWYYYQALDDLVTSIENLLRETDLYRWEDLESMCIQYLSNVKSFDSSSYILAEPDFEKQLADIQAQRERDMGLIKVQQDPVALSNDNSLNPYIILFIGIQTTVQFIQDFQHRYQAIMQSI